MGEGVRPAGFYLPRNTKQRRSDAACASSHWSTTNRLRVSALAQWGQSNCRIDSPPGNSRTLQQAGQRHVKVFEGSLGDCAVHTKGPKSPPRKSTENTKPVLLPRIAVLPP